MTFKPNYRLSVKTLDVTHPGYYAIKVTRTSGGFTSPIVTVDYNKEGSGSLAEDGVANIQFADGGHLIVTKLPNGFLKGDMSLNVNGSLETDIELGCKK